MIPTFEGKLTPIFLPFVVEFDVSMERVNSDFPNWKRCVHLGRSSHFYRRCLVRYIVIRQCDARPICPSSCRHLPNNALKLLDTHTSVSAFQVDSCRHAQVPLEALLVTRCWRPMTAFRVALATADSYKLIFLIASSHDPCIPCIALPALPTLSWSLALVQATAKLRTASNLIVAYTPCRSVLEGCWSSSIISYVGACLNACHRQTVGTVCTS